MAAHYDIFRDQLGIKYPAFGHALWEPNPGRLFTPVEVGDVGFIREGKFHRLFNALLPSDHPSHERFGVPEHYEPLLPGVVDHIDGGTISPNDFCSHGVTVASGGLEIFASEPVGIADVSFSCTRKGGAVLSIPVTAQREDTIARGDFSKWIIKHIDSWLAFTRRLGLGIDKMGDIILVTGRHRARSWTNVAFFESQANAQVSFGVQISNDVNTRVNWQVSREHVQGAVLSQGPSGANLPEDQCIFVRGYRVARTLKLFPRLRGAAGHTSNPSSPDYEPELEVVSLPSFTEYQDPLHVLLEYLAERAQGCDFVLVHDDDLDRIRRIGDETSLETLRTDVLAGYLQSFEPEIAQVACGVSEVGPMVAVFTEEPRSWATHQPIARTAGLVHTGQHPQPMMWTTITQPVVASFPRAQTLEPINDIPLTRSLLKIVLNDLSERLYHSFRRQVRLIVHGGAVMVLHPSFTHRESTQDINYVHRAFVSEYRALSFTDAEERLRSCIVQTAAKFNLGADWMNGHTDIALPMALDQYGRTYDPIFNVSTRSENSVPQTIFNERGLALVAVPWAWALALKLVRYAKQDPVDCAAVLRLGFSQRGIRWTLAGLEQWIMERCWPMGYSGYQPPQRAQLRQRMQDALTRAFPDGTQSLPSLPSSSLPSSSPPSLSLPSSPLSLLSSLPSLSSSLPSTPSLSVSPLPLSLPLSSSVHQQLLRMTSNSEKPSYFSQVVPYIENADTSFSYYDITSQNPEQQETRSRDR